MKKNIFLILLVHIFSANILLSENPCNVMFPNSSPETWGIGAYTLFNDLEINVYSETTGELFGKLVRNISQGLPGLSFKEIEGGIHYLNYNDVDYLYHVSKPIIKVDECFNPDYVKILWISKPGDELYVNKKEMESIGSEFITYHQFLIKHIEGLKIDPYYTNAKAGVNLIKNCLNLRTSPKITENKIICIPSNDFGNVYEVELKIIQIIDNWAKVKFSELHPTLNHDCNTTVKNEKTGWVKAISDNGFPNIWFSSTSY